MFTIETNPREVESTNKLKGLAIGFEGELIPQIFNLTVRISGGDASLNQTIEKKVLSRYQGKIWHINGFSNLKPGSVLEPFIHLQNNYIGSVREVLMTELRLTLFQEFGAQGVEHTEIHVDLSYSKGPEPVMVLLGDQLQAFTVERVDASHYKPHCDTCNHGRYLLDLELKRLNGKAIIWESDLDKNGELATWGSFKISKSFCEVLKGSRPAAPDLEKLNSELALQWKGVLEMAAVERLVLTPI